MEKFYIVKIGIRSSEFEATQSHAVFNETGDPIEKLAEYMAETFYGDGSQVSAGEYLWNDGEAVTYVEAVTEITEPEYLIIKRLIG